MEQINGEEITGGRCQIEKTHWRFPRNLRTTRPEYMTYPLETF
jgi:hypothetical protein